MSQQVVSQVHHIALWNLTYAPFGASLEGEHPEDETRWEYATYVGKLAKDLVDRDVDPLAIVRLLLDAVVATGQRTAHAKRIVGYAEALCCGGLDLSERPGVSKRLMATLFLNACDGDVCFHEDALLEGRALAVALSVAQGSPTVAADVALAVREFMFSAGEGSNFEAQGRAFTERLLAL